MMRHVIGAIVMMVVVAATGGQCAVATKQTERGLEAGLRLDQDVELCAAEDGVGRPRHSGGYSNVDENGVRSRRNRKSRQPAGG